MSVTTRSTRRRAHSTLPEPIRNCPGVYSAGRVESSRSVCPIQAPPTGESPDMPTDKGHVATGQGQAAEERRNIENGKGHLARI